MTENMHRRKLYDEVKVTTEKESDLKQITIT